MDKNKEKEQAYGSIDDAAKTSGCGERTKPEKEAEGGNAEKSDRSKRPVKKPLFTLKRCLITAGIFFFLAIMTTVLQYLRSGDALSLSGLTVWLTYRPIADQGYHTENADCPPGSERAILKAIEKEYWIKLDISITEDRVPVVADKDSFQKMTGIGKPVEDCSAEEIRNATLLNGDQRILTLADALRLIRNQVGLLLELQGTAEEIAPPVNELIKKYEGRVAVQSHEPRVLAWFLKNSPTILRGQIAGGAEMEKYSAPQKFVRNEYLMNFKGKPHYLVYEASELPKWSLGNLGEYFYILGRNIHSEEQLFRVAQDVDNFIFEGFDADRPEKQG